MRARDGLAHLLLAVVPVSALLAAGELAVRATGVAETCPNRFTQSRIWACDPILQFKVNPEIEPNGEPLNSAGFRGPEFGPKRPGVLRILALGDSCTFGYIVRAKIGFVAQPYPLRLQHLVDRRLGPGRVEVLNAGLPGYNSFQGLLLLRTKLRGLEPDLVTVRFGWNDHFLSGAGEAAAFREPATALGRAAQELLLRSKLYAFVRRLGLELRAWREPVSDQASAAFRGQRRWEPTLPPEDFARTLRRIVEVVRARGGDAWLLTAPRNPAPSPEAAQQLAAHNRLDFERLMQVHEDYAEIVRRVGAETGALVVDLESVYARHAGEPVFFESDVVHPSEGGHNLEAETLYSVLLRRGVLGAKATPVE
jgi:lysophospholipase L1-like esterase